LALALPPSARAQEVIKGKESYTLSAGEVVKHDLIVFTGIAHIEGDVDGDLLVWAQTVTVNGHVTGDVIGWCQHAQINGQVDGNVRTFNQSLIINGTVGRNVTTWSQTEELGPKSQVGGSLYAFGQAANVNGHLARDLVFYGESAQVSGLVGGDTTVTGRDFSITSSADLRGHTKFRGHHQPEISPGAKLASPIDFELLKERPRYTSFHFYWFQALGWGAAFLFGLILVLIAPGFFSDVLRASNRYGAATGFGILFLIATPIAAIIVCITLIGLPLGLSTIFLYLMALYGSQVFVGAWLGEKLLGPAAGTGATLGHLALGLLVIRVVRNLPYVGGWALSFVVIWGLGALVLAIYKNIRSRPALA
jgi:cytoskeletal protein CcmA (bactofilin family)